MENNEKNVNTQTEEKTYTQADIDRIVGERLARERAKYADYDDMKAKAEKFTEMEEAQKSELQKAQEKSAGLEKELEALKAANAAHQLREKIAGETGVPASLLTGDDEEAMKEQAKAILEFSGTVKKYPTVKDGGEVKPNEKTTTREQFKAWFDEQ